MPFSARLIQTCQFPHVGNNVKSFYTLKNMKHYNITLYSLMVPGFSAYYPWKKTQLKFRCVIVSTMKAISHSLLCLIVNIKSNFTFAIHVVSIKTALLSLLCSIVNIKSSFTFAVVSHTVKFNSSMHVYANI